jgi:hypothetical protein
VQTATTGTLRLNFLSEKIRIVKKALKDGVTIDVHETGCDHTYWIYLIQDRKE